ncbi:MAG TPA: caspase family protein [Anaerolineae bacterium]|nr:caspase family protein [Anaerolineae bacterium]
MSKRIALIIYNDTYQHPSLSRLKRPPTDTYTLAELLRDPAIGSFHRVELLLNQPAAEICRCLADLFHGKRRNDELLLYFIGHGLLDERGQLYLAAVDTRLDTVAETAISVAYLTGCMDRSFSRRQILLLDCHYSQISPTHIDSGLSAGGSLATVFRGRGYGRIVLAANHPAPDILAGETLGQATDPGFTHHLIQGLQTGAADGDKDGQVELRELYEYIQDHSEQTISWFQPRHQTYGDLDKFILARNPQQFVPAQPVKWDLISGAIMTPLTIIVIGGRSDLFASIGLAGLFLLLYTLLYLAPD